MRRRELAMAQLNPQSAIEIADVITGSPAGPTTMGRARNEAPRAVGFGNNVVATGGPR